MTDKTMQHECEFLKGIRLISVCRMIMMASYPFLALSDLMFCAAHDRLFHVT